MKKRVSFHWDAPQQNSFDALKKAITDAPVLQFPNYAQPFVMFMEASFMGLGAVLVQPDQRGKLLTAYRTLN